MDIKLTKNDKRYIDDTEDVYNIMQRVLLRDNKIDQEKEHFWIIGMDLAGYILYIELIALGSYRSVDVEPMNVFRVAVMKNAYRVIAVHNHPSGRLEPSKEDHDITDRLIQVARILNMALVDHLIISPLSYFSFKTEGVMDELEKSLKYVPTYQVIEMIRREEKRIAREKLSLEKDKTKSAQEQTKALIFALIEKDISIEAIAKILEVTSKDIEKILKKRK